MRCVDLTFNNCKASSKYESIITNVEANMKFYSADHDQNHYIYKEVKI